MSLSKADAAARLGVPEHEVLEVAAADGGHRVRTTDGVAYHVATGGEVSYLENFPKDTLFPVHPSAAPADEAPPAAEAEEAEEEVPDGPVGTVLAWVNRDKARAVRALKAERAREQPRSSLVEQLERLANP